MKYYVLAMNNHGGYDVIWTADKIAIARRHAQENIIFDMRVWGYSDGCHIVTDKRMVEYHSSVSVLKSASGTKLREDLKKAIVNYESQKCKVV